MAHSDTWDSVGSGAVSSSSSSSASRATAGSEEEEDEEEEEALCDDFLLEELDEFEPEADDDPR